MSKKHSGVVPAAPNNSTQIQLKKVLQTRRGFMKSLAAISGAIGAEIVYSQFMPRGFIPLALAEPLAKSSVNGKSSDLVVLNDRPLNAETPAHLLDSPLTPNDLFFIRNNGVPPENVDAANWTLTIDGESAQASKTYTLAELKTRFKHYSYDLTLECGGNGRSEFYPAARGNQWSTGAVGCAKWTGVRLADVLKDVGVKDDAVYVAYSGADLHLSRDPSKQAISRGVPIAKALQQESLIAWAMNDQDLPMMNGYPLRLVFGGWPASTSGKWLTGLHIRNQIHDGAKMGGSSYRVPCEMVAPGTEVADSDMCIIEEMPVKSLITSPKSGIEHSVAKALTVRGHAWVGDLTVKRVELSIDFGQTWQSAAITKAANLNAWQQFSGELRFPKKGYYEVWAKATDENGVSQPMVLPGWNPKGYLNNACHRVAVMVV